MLSGYRIIVCSQDTGQYSALRVQGRFYALRIQGSIMLSGYRAV
jgi:hypothetical protein